MTISKEELYMDASPTWTTMVSERDVIPFGVQVKVDKELWGKEESPFEYKTEGSAGFDIRARIDNSVSILPGRTHAFKTGIRLDIPKGLELQIRSRSGLALKHRVVCLNSPGTVDSDYRGELQIVLINHGNIPVTINNGDRIAQGVFGVVFTAFADLVESDKLSDTARGNGGFGHTGIK